MVFKYLWRWVVSEGIFLLEEDLGGGLIPHQGMTHFLLQMLISEEVGTRYSQALCEQELQE
jgi:hypothetical protein